MSWTKEGGNRRIYEEALFDFSGREKDVRELSFFFLSLAAAATLKKKITGWMDGEAPAVGDAVIARR